MSAHQDPPATHPAAEPAEDLPQQGTEPVPESGTPRPGTPQHGTPRPVAPEPHAPPSSGAPPAPAVPRTPPVPDSGAATRLARERNVWLCTVRADGTPHVTPVWFVHHLGRWWIGSDERAVKVRNVRRAPRVSLALEDGDHPLVAEGTTRVLPTPFPPEIVAAFREKYDWDVSAPRPGAGARVLLEVRTARWLLAGTAQ